MCLFYHINAYYSSYNTTYEKIGDTVTDISDQIPFDIPDGWEWCRLGMISSYAETKKKINAKDAPPDLWGLDLEDIQKGGKIIEKKTVDERKATGDKTFFSKGDILYSKLRPYLLKILIADEDGVCTPEIVPFHMYGSVNASYIVYLLKSSYVDSIVNGETYGIKMPRAGTGTMVNLLIPLPPLSEQHRIVAKIEELLPYIERYDEAEQKLTTLNAEFPDKLKKSILQMAVQGKLVPQNSTDEPASVLLAKIRAEKEVLIKQGKIKRDKNESVIYRRDNEYYEKQNGIETCISEQIPFEIPEGWEWCRLGSIFSHNTGKALNSSNNTGIKRPYITTSNLYWNRFDLSKVKEMYFSENEVDKCTISYGDLLVCEGGDIGRAAIWNYDYPMCIQNHIHRLRYYVPLCTYFYYYVILLYKSAGLIGGKGIGIQGLSSSALHNLMLPTPPLSEQYRIVAKIEEILPLCEKLS